MSEKRYTFTPGRNYLEESDFVVRLRREYLQGMFWGTQGVGFLLGLIAMIEILDQDIVARETIWPFVALLPLFLLIGQARRVLEVRRDYNFAATLYIAALLISMLVAMSLAPESWELRYVLPYLLTVISAASGLLLSRGRALLLTGIGALSLLPFAFYGYRSEIIIPALLLTAMATAIASSTAGSLYVMAEYSTQSYLMARQRANDFFENREELRRALARQEWLNEELQKTSAMLEKRAVQLETSSEVGKQATAVLQLDILLPLVARLIQARFGYYFVGIWLINQQSETVQLRAGMRLDETELSPAQIAIALSASSMLSDVCRSGRSRMAEDVSKIPDYYPLEQLPDTRSVLILPLHIGGQAIGALDIESRKLAAFDEQDRLALQTLADQLAVAIRNAQLYGAEQSRRQLAESLEATGRALSSSLNLAEVPHRILEQLDAVVPFNRGLLLIQEGQSLRRAAQHGFPEEAVTAFQEIPIREGDVFQKIVDSQEPVLIDDVEQDPSFKVSETLALHHSWLGLPLITKNRVVGMLSLTREKVGAFTADDAQLALTFTAQAAIALENAHLYGEIKRFNEQLEQMVQERTEELKHAYHQLEKMDRNKSDFINVAAHELRTPLTVIRGYTQIMQIHPLLRDEEGLRSSLEGIIAGADRLHRIVNSMLDVARIDSEVLNLSKRIMHLSEIFERLSSQYHATLDERRLSFSLDGIRDLPLIEADPGLLYKVFEQLLTNAIKFTPDGGSIAASGELVQVREEPAFVEVLIEDTGIGIDPEYQTLIFEKFYQTGEVALHSSGETSFKAGGPGLGLAIARGIIEAHGGRIWAESVGHDEEQCPGSRFHVWLPVGGANGGSAA